ncbi:MAG TPA: protein kinase [Gemmatimonadaceae bacterium]|nr:protein kinase [Gemmatimonadaceae bacterium]
MSPALRARLESSLGATYDIERELGPGGMARVFVATERALGRRVVIKVLSPELAAEVSTRRFEREIRLAASLQQANIVPVLSTGETDGLPHYTMPFVEGLSLRERLERDGQLPLADTISILRDIARALAYAHEHGVVHRDIKPENVLLSGDAAVVTDFGIAKAFANARLGDESSDAARPHPSTITQFGVSVGTPAYMSPERISADPDIDHRADIYAFGCLAFELLTGAPPFAASSLPGLFAAHLGQKPVDVRERNADVPDELAVVVMRCLEKEPANRPQSAREILAVLHGDTTTNNVARIIRRLSRRQRVLAAAALVLLVAVASGLALRTAFSGDADVPIVSVIPFINLGADAADEYLADGIADGLATALGKVSGVRVASRTLGYRYRGRRDLDARVIGEELDVTHVLHGSVQRVGGRLRLSAQLTRASDNSEIWSDHYDRSADDALAVQDEITRLVVAALPRGLRANSGAGAPAASNGGTANADAYDLYLRGRYLLQRRGAGVRQSISYLSEAIARDSGFARAQAAYALALELLPYFEPANVDSLNRLAIPAAQAALARDSTLAEAHTALGLAYQHQYQWARAEDAYKRAVNAQPPDADAHIQYGRFLFYTRTVREALPWFERARALDPTSAVASGWVGHLFDLSGRVSDALPHLRRAMDIDSTNPPSLVFMAQAQATAGRRDSARVYAERLWRVWPGWRPVAAQVLAGLGDPGRARQMLASDAQRLDATNIANIAAALGDSTRWFDIKERQTAERQIWPTYMSLSEPHLDYMRGSARFAAIVRSVGLDERIFTAPRGGRP